MSLKLIPCLYISNHVVTHLLCIFYVPATLYLLSAEITKFSKQFLSSHVYRLVETGMQSKNRNHATSALRMKSIGQSGDKSREVAVIPFEKVRKGYLGENDLQCES